MLELNTRLSLQTATKRTKKGCRHTVNVTLQAVFEAGFHMNRNKDSISRSFIK